jgi:hypothetical protein
VDEPVVHQLFVIFHFDFEDPNQGTMPLNASRGFWERARHFAGYVGRQGGIESSVRRFVYQGGQRFLSLLQQLLSLLPKG